MLMRRTRLTAAIPLLQQNLTVQQQQPSVPCLLQLRHTRLLLLLLVDWVLQGGTAPAGLTHGTPCSSSPVS